MARSGMPVAPLVSSGKSTAGKDCPSAAVAAASVAKGGGFVSLGAVGATPVSGGGSVLYSVFEVGVSVNFEGAFKMP